MLYRRPLIYVTIEIDEDNITSHDRQVSLLPDTLRALFV